MNPPGSAPSYDRLDERSKSHADKLEALEARCAKMEQKLDSIIQTLSEARGGWKTLMFIAGIAGVVGAALAKLGTWLPMALK